MFDTGVDEQPPLFLAVMIPYCILQKTDLVLLGFWN